MIVLVDYGAGNLRSVQRALEAGGASVRIARSAGDLADARAIVVPGVGHFDATRALGPEWRRAISGRLDAGAALLGICLGMQWLFDASDEAPGLPGLGVFTGTCRQLMARDGLKVPHAGWNTIARTRDDAGPSDPPSRLLDGIGDGTAMYFTHTYVAPVIAEAAAVTSHGSAFAAVVERGRVGGVQFHPEKSGESGLHVLRNFVAIASETSC